MTNATPSRHAWIMAGLVGTAAGLVLGGYEFIRSPSNTLLVEYYGKDALPTVMAAVPIVVVGMLYVYGRLVSALGPRRTLAVTTLACAVAIIGGWLALIRGIHSVAPALYLLRSAYVVLLIEQYWSLINSSITESEAKRVNGPICGIASIGAIIGGLIGERATLAYGTTNMILIAGIMTLPAMILTSVAYSVAARSGHRADIHHLDAPSRPAGDHLGMLSLLRNPTLALLLGIVFTSQGLVTALGILFQGHLSDAFTDIDLQTSYSFRFYTWINGIAGICQFVIAPILLSVARNHHIQIILPAIMLAFLGVYLDAPSLQTAGLAFMAFKVIDYSVLRASKEIYYVPMDFDARYRTKEVIDILGYRLGKGLTGAAFDMAHRVGLVVAESGYAIVGIGFTLVWLGCGARLRGPSTVNTTSESTP